MNMKHKKKIYENKFEINLVTFITYILLFKIIEKNYLFLTLNIISSGP